ncbi:MAG: sigma-70 family RNA polymerase sigma factor [Deltaproteobacteria bacterium]|nr:sigma-70 family RNA polymerase sigma factor [Deltaproteobacteria bacterium]
MLDYKRGKVQAFEILMKRYQNSLYNFIFRFMGKGEISEEVFQEVFIKLHRAAESYTPKGKFSTWLFTIARNQCVDTLRRQKVRKALSLDSPLGHEEDASRLGDTIADESFNQDELASAKEVHALVEEGLSRLNEDQREVFWLRQREGFKFEEIAEMTGVSVNTVKSRMRYALEGLKRSLKRHHFEELLKAS